MSEVTAVIPTTGRAELGRAVASALQQEGPFGVRVVVVDDSPGQDVIRDAGWDERVAIARTGGRRGGGYARNLGVENCSTEWVAFLDDDDEWARDKVSIQLDEALRMTRTGASPVLASRHRQDVAGELSSPIPIDSYSSGDVASYLFVSRRPGGGRASIYTSTLLCQADLARRVPWNPMLKRHQDWDWLIRLCDTPGVSLVQVREPLTTIHFGSAESISAKSDWQSSLRWADGALRQRSARVYVDFLAAQVLRYSLAARSARGAAVTLRRMFAARTFPSLSCLLVGLAGLLPRGLLGRVMNRRM